MTSYDDIQINDDLFFVWRFDEKEASESPGLEGGPMRRGTDIASCSFWSPLT